MDINKREISLNQLMTLMILFLIGGSSLSSTARYAGQNVWIVLLVAGSIGALFFTLYYRISKLHNYAGLPTILTNTLGGILGKILILVYAGFFMFRMISTGNYMTALAQETLMMGANQRTVIVMLLSTIIISSLYGLNVIGRSSEIFLVIVLLCMLPFLLSVFTSDIFNSENLIPILAEGVPGITKDIVRTSFFPYGELIVFLMVFPYVKQQTSNAALKRGFIAIAVATLLMIAISLTTVALIGATLTTNFEYPFYNAMQLAGISGFLERLDPLAIVIKVTSEYFKLVLYFVVTLLCVQSLCKKFNFKIVLAIISVLTFFIAPLVKVHEVGFMMDVMPFKVLPIFELAIPVLIWIISEIRFRKNLPAVKNKHLTQTNPGPI